MCDVGWRGRPDERNIEVKQHSRKEISQELEQKLKIFRAERNSWIYDAAKEMPVLW
jgi:hypothetical protein